MSLKDTALSVIYLIYAASLSIPPTKKWAKGTSRLPPPQFEKKCVLFRFWLFHKSVIQCRVNRCLIKRECPAVSSMISRRSDYLPTTIGQRVTIVLRTTGDVITTHTLAKELPTTLVVDRCPEGCAALLVCHQLIGCLRDGACTHLLQVSQCRSLITSFVVALRKVQQNLRITDDRDPLQTSRHLVELLAVGITLIITVDEV